jgi:hypothetical protein
MIPLEKVVKSSLKEITAKCKEDAKLYDFTENCVRFHLFSRFPERREYVLKRLNEVWGIPIDIHKLEDGKIIYAYITLNKIDKYIFVGNYSKRMCFFEEVPTNEEKFDWKRLSIG